MKLKTSQKLWAEIEVLPNGALKVVEAKRLQLLNQYRAKWVKTDARNLARTLNKAQYLIK